MILLLTAAALIALILVNVPIAIAEAAENAENRRAKGALMSSPLDRRPRSRSKCGRPQRY